MGSKFNRKQAEIITRHRYIYSILFDDERAHRCAYCGIPADTKDHVLPVSWMRVLVEMGDRDTRSEIVPCCRECNSIAGSKIFASFRLKKKYVQARIKQKHKTMPKWKKRELNELTGKLRRYVVASAEVHDYHETRWSFVDPTYYGESHNADESHLGDLVRENEKYNTDAEEILIRIEKKEKSLKGKFKPIIPVCTLAEAAKVCNTSPARVRAKVLAKKIPYGRDFKNRYVFELDDLKKLRYIIEEEDEFEKEEKAITGDRRSKYVL